MNECDWYILAGNDERINSHCLTGNQIFASVYKNYLKMVNLLVNMIQFKTDLFLFNLKSVKDV